MAINKMKQWALAISFVAVTSATAAPVTNQAVQQHPVTTSNQPTVSSQVGLYAGFAMGGYYRNMQDGFVLAAEVAKSDNQPIHIGWDQGKWSYALGLNMGYRFTDELSFELGIFHLQPQQLQFKSGSGSDEEGTYCNSVYCYSNGSSTKISTWATYVGVKLQAEVMERTSLFAKVAAAYVDTRYRINLAAGSELVGGGSAEGSAASSSTYWEPALAAGIEYQVTDKWRMSGQYMVVLSGNTISNDPATVDGAISTINDIALPAVHLFTVAAEYRFLT